MVIFSRFAVRCRWTSSLREALIATEAMFVTVNDSYFSMTPQMHPMSHSTHSSPQTIHPFLLAAVFLSLLRLGYHANLVRVFAVDDTIPTMPILMEAAVGDFFAAIETSRFTFREEAE